MKKGVLIAVALVTVVGVALGAWYYKSHRANNYAENLGLRPELMKTFPQMPPDSILKVDLNQDLTKLSLQDLRLTKNALYARQGYCFMDADLRGYFTANLPTYDSLMNLRWELEEEQSMDSTKKQLIKPISFSAEEQKFINKINDLIKDKLKQNFTETNGRKMANADNIINLFQLKKISPEFLGMLRKNNFVIVPDTNVQLFHVYEQNDYNQIPNFVTTDLYLQMYHMYFSYVLKSLEKEKFIPLITQLTSSLYDQSMTIANTTKDAPTKKVAEFNAVYFAIPHDILTGKKSQIPASLAASYDYEMKHIAAEDEDLSKLLNTTVNFHYGMFKPRGHYTRNDSLKKYFKAMMWLQTAYQCREEGDQLKNDIFMAYLLNNGHNNEMQQYKALHEAIEFLIGEADNISVLDICDLLKQKNTNQLTQILEKGTVNNVSKQLASIVKNKNKITPTIALSCTDKINFMPQRYLPDNEVLQHMFDSVPDAQRPYPKGLDVMAAFGVGGAEDILLNEEHDDAKWSLFKTRLAEQKKHFNGYGSWDKSVYNKWLQTLVSLQNSQKDYQPFMQTREWGKKNLNTALASWAELKHDAILYGEQPEGAECGDGGPPPPITVGYIEPNVPFWERLLELTKLTEAMLLRNNLLTDDLKGKTAQVKEQFDFALNVSKKELKGIKLSEQEYDNIEIIGATFEHLTLSIIDHEKYFQFWSDVSGPDHKVAVVADVFSRDFEGDKHPGVLHEATGGVNTIYVVVEIDGYLYITKGATFSYYEFVEPPAKRLNDEEWQKRLDDHKTPPIPKWMEELILPMEKIPQVDERVTYSSGC